MELLKNQWAAGQFTDLHKFGNAILNAKAIGKCEAFALLSELDYSQLLSEIDYEEPIRARAEGESSATEDV